MSLNTFFSGGGIDRRNDIRSDAARLETAWYGSETRFIAIWESRCLVENQAAVLLELDALGPGWSPDDGIYLGQLGEQHVFAIGLPEKLGADGPGEQAFDNFRGLLGDLNPGDAALLAYAKGMVEWHKRHQHCGICGAQNRSLEGGFVMSCTNPGCDSRTFPRLDPAIIVLTRHEGRCLLGRQVSWPDGRYSTIAGFLEPGESLEDAVRREVKEETDIDVGAVKYLGSQPWPFPTALMIGFHAEATSTAIHLNDGELADAGWFDRQTLASGEIVLPPPTSIAFKLIEQWFNEWDGPALSSLGLSGSFSRRTGERT